MKKVLTNIAMAILVTGAVVLMAFASALLFPLEVYIQHQRSKRKWVLVRSK